MIIVIQCASRKKADAGQLLHQNGKSVLFVAYPNLAPEIPNIHYAHPDDRSPNGTSWREQLLALNENPDNNSLNLSPAWSLYLPPAYKSLVGKFGKDKVYILSAGWGLISADFLTPAYDITFSASADRYKRRRQKDNYKDLTMLKSDTDEPVIFLGGKDYIPLFCELTSHLPNQRIVIYNSDKVPLAPNCDTLRYNTSARTNWHYQCANAIIDGSFASA